MNVIFSTDRNGLDMLLVAAYSVVKNNAAPLSIFVFSNDLTKEDRSKLASIAKVKPGVSIKVMPVDDAALTGVELTNHTVSMPAFFRYFAPDIIKEDKALYMDIDMLCVSSLEKLYATPLNGYYLGAVEDYFVSVTEDYPGFKKGIGFAKKDPYMNSGLMLMNLVFMRESGIMTTFWDILHRKSEIIPEKFNIFADQTVMNLCFKEKIKKLPAKYNVLTTAMKYVKYSDVVIAHFAGPDKPFTFRDEQSAVFNDFYCDYYLECMNIIGDKTYQMIKKNGRRIGGEATRAISEVQDYKQVAIDKTNHTIEIQAKYDKLDAKYRKVSDELKSVYDSIWWRSTKPFRVVTHSIRKKV